MVEGQKILLWINNQPIINGIQDMFDMVLCSSIISDPGFQNVTRFQVHIIPWFGHHFKPQVPERNQILVTLSNPRFQNVSRSSTEV